jgi:hypothetical protein
MAAAPANLCVSVARSQASIGRGQTANYTVSVWEQNGSVAGVALSLKAAPSPLRGTFTFGCGTKNGAASCNIGTVSYPGSNARQLQAQVSVPASDTSATSATLTVTAGSKSVKTSPTASVTVAVTAASGAALAPNVPAARNANLPLGDFPSALNGTGGIGSYLSNGGNASGLFPTINPSSVPSPASGNQPKRDPQAETAADASTLPLGMPVVDAQIAGLVALAIALGLAVTRLSVRRRPRPLAEQAHKS